ncbi:MAG: hypothetical protein M1824_004030 [Vezdaea acicularis]|nr:MAG: hypothetical protein M1824_004030 [Vezdaea acicularis]
MASSDFSLDSTNMQMSLSTSTQDSRASTIQKIENMIEGVLNGVIEDREQLSFTLGCRNRSDHHAMDASIGVSSAREKAQTRTISFPGKTPKQAWHFTVIMRILELIHEALINDVTTTKRDIFYKDTELFIRQSIVDRYVDDLALTFGTNRQSLNVTASAKGLIIGVAKIRRWDGTHNDCSLDIAVSFHYSKSYHDNAGLTCEESLNAGNATFHALASSSFWRKSINGKGAIITAKGYPDISTRSFLRMMTNATSVPCFMLVDYDPDGIGILSNYKHGSVNLAHENANLNAPSVRWLGLHGSDVHAISENVQGHGLVPLTLKDRKKALGMLKKGVAAEGGIEPEWRNELQAMLVLNMKAEMQVMRGCDMGGFEGWLDRKMERAMET